MTCTWEADSAWLGTAWESLDTDVQERALMLATESLQMLTLYRVGTCPVTIRPCPAPRPCPCAWNPHLGTDGLWRNNCRHQRACAPISEVDLPGPVGYVDSLKINGVEIDLHDGDWRIDNGHLLVWQGIGVSPTPATQDLNLPDTAPGTWSVTYSQSYPVGKQGRMAVAHLAAEFAKAASKSGKCSLPRGVASVVRSGVTFQIESGLFPNGLTGIDVVDQFILKWAPAGAPSRSAQVFNPRTAGTPRRTSPVLGRPAPGSALD